MFSKTTIVLSAAFVLGLGFSASAATKRHPVSQVHRTITNPNSGGCTASGGPECSNALPIFPATHQTETDQGGGKRRSYSVKRMTPGFGAVIVVDPHDTITLPGVTTAQLAARPSDFHFF